MHEDVEPEIRIAPEYWRAEFEIGEAPVPVESEPPPPKAERFRRPKRARPEPATADEEWDPTSVWPVDEPTPPNTRTDWSLASIAKVEWEIFQNRLAVWTAPLWFH